MGVQGRLRRPGTSTVARSGVATGCVSERRRAVPRRPSTTSAPTPPELSRERREAPKLDGNQLRRLAVRRAPVDRVDAGARRVDVRTVARAQNRTFTANWICRAEPESPVGKRVFVITPNVVLPTVAMRPGSPRLAWLKMLNASTRNCSARRAAQPQVLDDRQVGVAEARPDDRVAPQIAEVEDAARRHRQGKHRRRRARAGAGGDARIADGVGEPLRRRADDRSDPRRGRAAACCSRR